jgi:hypothetical protein
MVKLPVDRLLLINIIAHVLKTYKVWPNLIPMMTQWGKYFYSYLIVKAAEI